MAKAAPNTRARVRNLDQLCSRGLSDLRRDALEIAEVGLAACDGGGATREAVSLTPDGVMIDGTEHRLEEGQRLFVLGAGKATLPIAEALEDVLGNRIDGGVVILRRGETSDLRYIDAYIADHPLPTRESVEGALHLEELAEEAREGDLVIAIFTGGSSALASLPPDGVTFEDKRRLHELLLGSGMPISNVNTVRKHVSTVKGGRLAADIAPARIVNLTISDVAGDVHDLVTDPSVQDTSTVGDAIAVLKDYGIWDQVPASIVTHLKSPAAESPDLSEIEIHTSMLVTGIGVCEAMVAESRRLGYEPVILTTTLEGEAREMGRFIADMARSSSLGGYPFEPGTVILGCGGENAVTIAGTGSFGDGGPGQEAALAAAALLDGRPVAALFMDTDGSDGGTDAAGAICDGRTAERASEIGLDLRKALLTHTSREPLRQLGDLLDTGATGTNVNDLFVTVIGKEAS
jgi:hydroxypyruvate reductase/glycerate 2-kinase